MGVTISDNTIHSGTFTSESNITLGLSDYADLSCVRTSDWETADTNNPMVNRAHLEQTETGGGRGGAIGKPVLDKPGWMWSNGWGQDAHDRMVKNSRGTHTKTETGYYNIGGKLTHAEVLVAEGLAALQDLEGKEDIIMYKVIES